MTVLELNCSNMESLMVKQMSILLWKSWIMRRRHWISAIFELVLPILLAVATALIYHSFSVDPRDHRYGTEGVGWQPPTYYTKPTHYKLNEILLYSPRYLILYTPEDEVTHEIMDVLRNKFEKLLVHPVRNESVMLGYLINDTYSRYDRIGLVLTGTTPTKLKLKIRIKDRLLIRAARRLFPYKYSSGPADKWGYDSSAKTYDPTWFYSGFSRFTVTQLIMSDIFFDYLCSKSEQCNRTDSKTVVNEVILREIPYPKYYMPPLGTNRINTMFLVSMMIVTGYIVICPLIVKRITDEKVAKAKEMLRMMGMSDWVFWGSHFINFFVVMFVQSLVITFLMIYGFFGVTAIRCSNFLIFFISSVLFNANSILSSMLLTTVFNRPIIAVVASVVLYQISYTVPVALLDPMFRGHDSSYEPWTPLLALSTLIPTVGFHWFLTLLGNIEVYGHGLSWNNLWEPSVAYKDFTPGYVMLLQFVSLFVYGTLIWYVDSIWPFQFGIPKPFYFPLLPSYWCPEWCVGSESVSPAENKDTYGVITEHFEREPSHLKAGIECYHLQKKFHHKMAVSDVTLNIYSGQITVLLGHNGAGKTTTMNMITGIFPPTAGEVKVGGYDVRRQTKQARRSLALCPQDNVLYNELSCAQHLKLYALLKNHPWNDLEAEVDKILGLVELSHKRNSTSNELSGGMKRKLCLGVAMIADSRILVLDEPTSGMDPEARRHMWDTLQAIRRERTILLTTHYMEEADALADRIAIMSEGSIKCCGSPMFLKKAFGAGYHLRLQKRNKSFSKQRTLELIRSVMPEAEIKSEINSEVIVSLEGQERAQDASKRLASLFTQLENAKQALNIESCGLTVTTMEDVFLRVGNEYDDNYKTVTNGNNKGSDETLFQSIQKNIGLELWLQQLWGLFLKRFHFARRYWPMLSLQVILPALLFMTTLLIDNTMKVAFSAPLVDRKHNLTMYGKTVGFFQIKSDEQDYQKFADLYNKTSAEEGVQTFLLGPKDNPDNWTLDHGGSDLNTFIRKYLVGAQVEYASNSSGLQLIPWYNREATHSLPSSINILYQSVIRSQFPEASISVHNYPVSDSHDYSFSVQTVKFTAIITCSLMVPLTVPFLAASYVLFPVHERVDNSKLLQLMTGISSLTFWLASYLFDLLTHLVATSLIFLVFVIFDYNNVFMASNDIRIGLFLMLFLFGFASIPLAYLTSLTMKKPSTGYALLVIVYLISGLILKITITFFLMWTNISRFLINVLQHFSRLLPVYSMTSGILKLYKIGSYKSACNKMDPTVLFIKCQSLNKNDDDVLFGCCEDLCRSENKCYHQMDPIDWSDHGVLEEFTYLLITGTLYWLLLLILEIYSNIIRYIKFGELFGRKRITRQCIGTNIDAIEDKDVAEERQRVNTLLSNADLKTDAIVVKDLSKTFGKFIPIKAVNKLSFGVHREEVFGLLGVNGAGKTTTFRMLTGDETVSSGDAWSEGQSLLLDLRAFQTQIGYCPQFDALLNKLTGRETLYLFCRLRGMPSNMISSYVSELVAMVDLVKHVDKCTETYSGGNRRKLSLAVALCAAPPIIFLDEPTSGVDPSARRKIWSTLAHLQQRYGSAFVLTSHSMEECEALCQRIAIMVNGQFQCLGSVQHLRNKFGQGFTILLKIRPDMTQNTEYLASLQIYFSQVLPSAVLKDTHQGLIHYHVTDTRTLWSHMFTVMEQMKTKFFLEDYVISDTTLEQIFLAFARTQR